eukprot:TRINITY_DN1958_c0_g1_i1.p1 TRINITY_DN1958_c0_g1~~TRINITY_DN1958_c0_g1_i1.p1  ORF type:complete len:369 (-),score=101.40 TRINITY_DN1958_c0_g1_i1:59-1165(-)
MSIFAVIITGLIMMVESSSAQGQTTTNPPESLPSEVLIGRIVLLSLIGPITLFMSYLPWLIEKKFRNTFMDVLAVGSALSAGVILGAAFSHISPDASGAFAEYFDMTNPDFKYADYPFSGLVAIGIFFSLICLDKLLIDPMLSLKHSKTKSAAIEHVEAIDIKQDKSLDLQQQQKGMEIESDEVDGQHNHHDHHHGAQNHVALALENFGDQTTVDMHLKRLGTAYIFLAAMSVHSIFDGLAVGSENSSNGFLGLMVAIVIHKMLDGFALGVPIFYAKFTKLQTFLALTFCAMMTPLGIVIGWVTTAAVNGAPGILARAIFLSMSLGSFIYIGLIELLPAGLQSPRFMKWKLGLAIIGWGAMALIAVWV